MSTARPKQGMVELEQAMALLSRMLARQELVTDIGRDAVGIIMRYARTWRLLLDYDEGNVPAPAGQRDPHEGLSVAEARKALDALADKLKSRGEAHTENQSVCVLNPACFTGEGSW